MIDLITARPLLLSGGQVQFGSVKDGPSSFISERNNKGVETLADSHGFSK